MNVFFNNRYTVYFTFHDNIDINKLIKAIKKLNKVNDNMFILGESDTSDTSDNHIYITIENKNMKINFSHIFYDGYSFYLIFQKIEQIYKDEIKNYKFKFYDINYSKLKFVINNIKLLPLFLSPQVNIKTICNSFIENCIIKKSINKKIIKILKTKLKEISTKEIMYYLVDKIGIENYYLVLNARKRYTEYENVLGNLVYFSKILNKNDEMRTIIQKDYENVSLEKKLNSSIPNGQLLVNSYLNFIFPSFIKNMTPIVPCNNYIVILPINSHEKYILVEYYY